jgi:hypothetical protein
VLDDDPCGRDQRDLADREEQDEEREERDEELDVHDAALVTAHWAFT